MKPWENGNLTISENQRYLKNGSKPFFWLGDTAWLIFSNLSEQEAYLYLKNRAEKGFNVIQAVLVYATEKMTDINKMPVKAFNPNSVEYWEKCDKIISMAEELGVYMALLPSWGSLVKKEIINEANVEKYALFLAKRYGKRKNIIWLLGGDIKANNYVKLYDKLALCLKKNTENQLIGFHPFGRCSSSMWFQNSSWLDFNMFQSGHRRYDQCNLSSWDDNEKNSEFFGEDNWKYVDRDLSLCNKPTLDGEPSYEGIPQGLHDKAQPYWSAREALRYAYWSVFQGSCGHTYGDNSVMQFFTGELEGITYGAEDNWKTALHHKGSSQLIFLKRLMESVDFTTGRERCDLLLTPQGEKHERISVFAGKDFLFAYDYLSLPFELDLSDYINYKIYYYYASNGIYSYVGEVKEKSYKLEMPKSYDDDKAIVLVVKK